MSTNYSKKTTSLLDVGARATTQATALTYEPFFGLNEKPFSLYADSRFVYDSPTHSATREGLLAGIRRREGLQVLTGEIGTGKTTLCRAALRDLGRKTYSSIVPDPFASREDLFKMMLIDFGVLSIQQLTTGELRQASRTELGYLLSEFLDSLPPDAFVVVVIDEAQNLTLPLIEETRILSDSFGASGRLQIVFVGQPELHAKLKLPEMRQVDQRVCGYHRLAPMSRDAVAGYLQHRLQVAGGARDRVLFPPEVVDNLHRRSGGVPRLINRVCDRALHLAYERQAERVDREILDTALLELGADTLSPTWDSIIFAETPAPAAAPAAQAAPAPQAATTPSLLHDDDFEQQINQWVEKDLASPRHLKPARVVVAAEAPKQRPVVRTAAPKREAPAPRVTTNWPKDLRSETYIQRLWRIWAKRAGIALAVFVALNAVVAAALLLPTQTPAELPAIEAPKPPVTEAPPAEVPLASPVAVPGDARVIDSTREPSQP